MKRRRIRRKTTNPRSFPDTIICSNCRTKRDRRNTKKLREHRKRSRRSSDSSSEDNCCQEAREVGVQTKDRGGLLNYCRRLLTCVDHQVSTGDDMIPTCSPAVRRERLAGREKEALQKLLDTPCCSLTRIQDPEEDIRAEVARLQECVDSMENYQGDIDQDKVRDCLCTIRQLEQKLDYLQPKNSSSEELQLPSGPSYYQSRQ